MQSKKRKGIFAGSFDPITNGHLDIICRASKLFDELQIGVLYNPNKKGLFNFDERVELINAGFKTFNEAHSIDSGIGYFVDRDGSTVFAFHEVTDQHVMHLMASLVLKMAEKCEADPKAIIGALDTIITEHVNG